MNTKTCFRNHVRHGRASTLIAAAVLALALMPTTTQAGAILNTLDGFDDSARGWNGGLKGLFSGSGGNTESIQFGVGGRVQHRSEHDRIRLQTSMAYKENDGKETERNVVVHLRHNHDLSPDWATVLFGQIQHNPFQRLQRRWLLGAGLRHDLYDDDRGQVRVGATPMLEIEILENTDGPVTRGRMSVFAHVARRLSDNTRLNLVGFWQPLFSDLADARAVGNATVTVEVTGNVDLKVGASVEHDARPPAGVERTDWETFVGLELGF